MDFPLKIQIILTKVKTLEQIGFIGTYDKKDLLLNIANILVLNGQKVLIVDATLMQRLKYIAPRIGNTNTYVSEYRGIDIALGFMNLGSIAQYLGTPNSLPYDFVFVDSDNLQTINSFMIPRMQKIYLVTSYEKYELERTMELLKILNLSINITKVVYSPDINDKQEQYFNQLLSKTPVKLLKNKVLIADTSEDRKVTLENQLLSEIRYKHYSSQYKSSLEYITALITENILPQTEIRKTIKKD